MDIEEKDHRLEQLKQALASIDNNPPTVVPEPVQTWDSIDFSSIPSLTTIDLSALTTESMNSMSPNAFWNSSTVTSGTSSVYTIGGGGGGGLHVNANTSIAGGGWSNGLGKVKIKADDVEFNGRSLLETLDRIEEQLGILDCDDSLESEWKELRALGQKYRKMKKHIEDKLKTFETLKK